MQEEIDALAENKTWDLVKLPKGKNVVGCKWVYKTKHDSNGNVSRHKARLVAKGYAQMQGIDYDETFAPVAKMATLRTILAVGAARRWVLHHMDVKNAFLHGNLEEEVYMCQPPGFEDKNHPEYVCKLKKALYGLKQAPRAWHKELSESLKNLAFKMSKADPSLYVKRKNDCIVVILIYVDDLIIGGDSMDEIRNLKKNLEMQFHMKDLGDLRYFLGIEMIKSEIGIYMLQKQYTTTMLKKYGMLECKPIGVPVDKNYKLRADLGAKIEDVNMYRSMVGSLIYLTITRPDLSYRVGLVSQFMQQPAKSHFDCIRRILRYVKATQNYGLFYRADLDLKLEGYTDADWAGSQTNRSSTSGYIFTLRSAGISWSSKKQAIVALSSTEAEYRGTAIATCEEVWIRRLLADLGEYIDGAVTIWCDNMSSIQLAKNPVFHARTKHIEVHYHFVREKVIEGEVDLMYVNTNQQVVDILTKALSIEKHTQFRDMMGVIDIDMIAEKHDGKED